MESNKVFFSWLKWYPLGLDPLSQGDKLAAELNDIADVEAGHFTVFTGFCSIG